MPRYTDQELDAIKQGVDLVALVRSKGVELSKHGGKDLKGLCPFHKEDTPSFIVTPSKNLYHCMGCGAAGSPIDFVMKYDGLSFRHAVELLREQNPSIYSSATAVKKSTVPKLDCPLESTAEDFELLEQTISYYQERLQASSDPLAYLESRKISKEAIKHFRIGYADRTLGLRLPFKNRIQGKELRENLMKVGLFRKTGHEHFRGCVTFPIFNDKGQVTEIYGRRTGKQKSGIYHLYLPGKHVGIFNPQALRSENLILCESIIDALTLWSYGHKNVTTIYGTEGFTQELEQAIITHKVQRVTFAYDNDKAGNRAVDRDHKRLSALGIQCFRLNLPVSQDINQYAVKGSNLSELLNASQWLEPAQSINNISLATKNLATKEKSIEPAKQNICENPCSSVVNNEPVLVAQNDDYEITLGDRSYRIRGLHKNQTLEVLKVSLRIIFGELLHLDQVDFYSAQSRRRFVEEASQETGIKTEIIKKDLAKLLLLLEQKQEERFSGETDESESIPELNEEEKAEALELLKHPNLLEKILEDFAHCGLVGEENNKLTGYLATVSRKLNKPLAIIIQSTSAAGKSSLMDAILQMIPKEDRIKYSAMTGQSLYYLGESNLKNKILAIVEEEGAEKASYALKLLQSEGELTIASTGKDDLGRMKTEEYHVEGPVMIFLTTTAIDIDEELMNRCLILTVDESREQTARIHDLQRMEEKFEGLKQNALKERILRTHQNAQRLLKPIAVVNPYADQLTFLNDKTRTRRDHKKYLTLIKTIALLHQYQRPLKEREGYQFIEVTVGDIASANRIAHEVLGRSLDDLPPQTRKLLVMLKEMANQMAEAKECDPGDIQFSRRQVRQYTGWTEFQVRKHLTRLQELEYIFSFYGSRGQSFVYELFFDGEDISAPQLCGLIDTSKLLERNYDESSSSKKASSSPQRASNKPPSSEDRAPTKNHINPQNRKASGQ